MVNRELNCSEARELVAARELELEVDREAIEALELHLAACEGCRRALREERRVSALLESTIVGDGGESLAGDHAALADRIAGALPARAPGANRRFGLRSIEAVAAAVLFGVGLFVGTLFRGPGVEGPAPSGTGAGKRPAITADFVGSKHITQRFLPDGRLQSWGKRRIILPDLHNPGFSVVFEIDELLEDPLPTGEYR